MTRTHKKIVGFLGLLTVVAVTAIAVFMPTPETQATAETTSITDTIVVKVANDVPDVKIIGIPHGEVITEPEQSFSVAFSNVDVLTVNLKHVDLDGVETNYVLDEFEPGYAEGEESYNLTFLK